MTLPTKFEDKDIIGNMNIGQSGYTMCWAMWVDSDGQCYLNEDYPLENKPGGTVKMKITRVESGYIAHIHETGEKWSRQNGPSYATPKERCYGFVVGFALEDTRKEPENGFSFKKLLDKICNN